MGESFGTALGIMLFGAGLIGAAVASLLMWIF